MKKIKLTQGKFTIVDDKDFNQNKWYFHKGYAAKSITIISQNKSQNIKHKQKTILLHRVIMENKLDRKLRQNEDVDHINGNGLDNRRSNLRICTRQQNLANSIKHKKISSIYKGVYWYKNYEKWHSSICFNYKRINLGYFNNEIEAAQAYNKAAQLYFGEFARLNDV